jgi:hypothetical protein
MSTLRIAFLHLAPWLRHLQANRQLIDRAVTTGCHLFQNANDVRFGDEPLHQSL